MKNLLKKMGILSLSLISVAGLAACGGSDKPNNPDDPNNPNNPNEPDDPTKPAQNASGAQSYVAANYAERTEILGKLEKYAVENQLTGIALYEDSGYVMYDNAVTKGSETYITGFGHGVLSDGSIDADLASEQNTAWKRYYHTYEAENPNTINYMNNKGSVVGNLIGYVSGSYWTTHMNEFSDGYEWVPALANSERPIAVNAKDGLATKYKFEVKVGSELVYNTGSDKSPASKYKGQQVKVEDYITAYKMLYTQAYGMARGAEQLEGSGSIKGMAQYYNDSKNSYNEVSWNNNVGIKGYMDGGKAYIEVEFNLPTSQFYAMYYLSSSLAAPIPEQFIKDLGNGDLKKGMEAYGNMTSSGLTPVDTFLSTGPYLIERWDAQQIVFKRNDLYTAEPGKYEIAGIHYRILTAAKEDPEAAFKEFLSGNLHSVGIPSTQLKTYKTDPRTVQVDGTTTTKLNVNTTTKAEWEYLFGVNGTVAQTAESEYWNVEPAMSNEDFVNALSYAINRVEYADQVGATPTANYFANAYLSDPENGVSYNSTDAHKDAMADFLAGTDGYGYSLEKAKTLFKRSTDALIASGAYKSGDTITLDVVWQSQSNVDVTGNKIESYWKAAFDAAGCDLKLEIKNIVPNSWEDAYYKHMMVGQFDLGYGGITGNPMNPLNFMEVLKSDNSSGFTLNWGPNTNEVSKELEYDNMYWSFNSLWEAAEKGGYFENGVAVAPYDASLAETNGVVMNADGTATLTFDVSMISGVEGITVDLSRLVIFTYFNVDGEAVYGEEQITGSVGTVTLSEDKTKVTVVLSKATVDKYNGSNVVPGYLGIDFYFETDILGVISEQYKTINFEFTA